MDLFNLNPINKLLGMGTNHMITPIPIQPNLLIGNFFKKKSTFFF